MIKKKKILKGISIDDPFAIIIEEKKDKTKPQITIDHAQNDILELKILEQEMIKEEFVNIQYINYSDIVIVNIIIIGDIIECRINIANEYKDLKKEYKPLSPENLKNPCAVYTHKTSIYSAEELNYIDQYNARFSKSYTEPSDIKCYKNTLYSPLEIIKQKRIANQTEKILLHMLQNKILIYKSINSFEDDKTSDEIRETAEMFSLDHHANICDNRYEHFAYRLINNIYETEIAQEQQFKWCFNQRTERYFLFDFYIDKYKLIIELDGGQHFFQVKIMDRQETIVRKDVYKQKLALENGLSVIRILQHDIYYNLFDYNKLYNAIKLYDKPTVVYICNDENIYKMHKEISDRTMFYNGGFYEEIVF